MVTEWLRAFGAMEEVVFLGKTEFIVKLIACNSGLQTIQYIIARLHRGWDNG